MLSKVFRLEKKSRDDRSTSPRPASSGDKRPNYVPLQQATLLQGKKRTTVHDAQAEAMDQELDLLELVCRSDSLHRRLDELQAKYEKMDDGMESLTVRREVTVGQDIPAKRLVGFRVSRSFEEPECKKPNFLQRIFGHRLSKSKDDLLNLDPPRFSALDTRPLQRTHLAPPQLPMRQRRSASEDMLSSIEQRPEKRQTWGSEVWERDTPKFQCPAPPPPPPPPPALEEDMPKVGALKRKRVIRIHKLHAMPRVTTMGSTESCSDSTDSDREGRGRGSGSYSKMREAPAGNHLDSRPAPRWGSATGSPGDNTIRSKSADGAARASEKDTEIWKYDPVLVGMKRTPGEGREAAPNLTLQRRREAFARDKRNTEVIEPCERPTRKTPRATSFEEGLGVREGPVRRCPARISEHEEQLCVTLSSQASPGSEQKIKSILKNSERCEGEKPERPKTDPLTALTRSDSSKEVLLTHTPDLVRRHQRSPSSPGVTTRAFSPIKVLRTQASLEGSKVRHSPQRQLLPHVHRRSPLAKAFSTEEGPKCPALYKPRNQDMVSSIKELDHFLSAIIDNLEAQLHQSGGSAAFGSRQISLEDSRRRRKKKKMEEEAEDLQQQQQQQQQQEKKLELVPMKSGGMSECGACGRRWVEPRLLPCLHTLCTPCLHTRATQITPPATASTATATSRNDQATPIPGSRCGSRSSQEHEITAASSTPIASPTPSLAPEADPGERAATLCNGSVTTTGINFRDERLPTSSTSPTSPDLYERSTMSPQETQEAHESASRELDSVIELLTQLSPTSCSTSPVPKLTLTPTPSDAAAQHAAMQEDMMLSPSSTLDSSCDSKAVWVVWCPECGYEADVPPGGVECFPLNYILQKQLVLEALNSSSTIIYCDLCQDEVVAEERCDTCPANLCHLCSNSHARQRRTAHHKVLSLQEARIHGIREVAHTLVCSTHGEGEVGWWCRGCQEPLCAACLATLHCGHQTSTVEQEAPQTRRNLSDLLEQATERMGELLTTVEDLTGAATRVQQRGHSVCDQVNTFIDDYILALEEHRHTLLKQVRQACERSQRSIVTESQKAGQTAAWLRQGCDLTHDLLHHAGHAEVLALAPLLTHRLQTLLKEKVEGWSQWEKLDLLREHRAGRVRGHRLQGVIADSPAHPAQSRLKPLCEVGSVTVGARVVALLVARDQDGQPITHGGETVAASFLTADASSTLCGCSVRDREDGSYEIVFSPPVAGSGVLHVTLQGEHVMGSPLDITVKSASGSGGGSSTTSTTTNTTTSTTASPVEGGREVGGGGGGGSGGGGAREGSSGPRQHTGVYHCCAFCSSGGDKTATCACGATIHGYMGMRPQPQGPSGTEALVLLRPDEPHGDLHQTALPVLPGFACTKHSAERQPLRRRRWSGFRRRRDGCGEAVDDSQAIGSCWIG
ncbi:hypothetical protein O3P69_017212 [Scylla paramamosain]|uniref:B box-type domain-containing protein n=1 Tax=Scylla paramamosain TaxID=85552 RepID=A0AAW0TWJ1_SCYPA